MTRIRFEEALCEAPVPAGQADKLRCGVLTVPENWDVEGGRSIRLKIAVLKASGPSPEPDPFVYLSGGPGFQSLRAATGLQLFTAEFAQPIQSKRDLVFVDLRGTGLSEPSLDCPEMDEGIVADLAKPLSPDSEMAARLSAFRACHERLAAENTDFSGYTSAQMVRDLEALRMALGYERWNLWGVSYGSRLALTVLRDAPLGTRSVILDSVVPLEWPYHATLGRDFARAFRGLAASCSANAKCGASTPDLAATFGNLIPSLDRAPLVIHPVDSKTGQPTPVVLTGFRYAGVIQQAMYATDVLPLLPVAIAEATQRGTTFAELAINVRALSSSFEAMQGAVLCQEAYPLVTREELAAGRDGVDPVFQIVGDVYGYPLDLSICEVLQLKAGPAIEGEPVRSDVPALVLAGSLDPITPPENGRNVAEQLSHSHYLEFPGFGHGILRAKSAETERPRCAMRIVAAFLDNPSSVPDSGCIEQIPAVPF